MSFLFGGDTPQVQYNPVGASGGGLNTSIPSGGGNITVTPDANRLGAVGDVANTYSDLAKETGDLRSKVTPGYNDLLTSQLGNINDSARSAIGNLRTNLQSRRILGSSFGQDTIGRTDAEFSKQRNETMATNYLSSLDASNKLLQQQYQARTQAANTGLTELNLEANVANGLIGNTNQILAQNAQTNAKLEAEAQAGQGKMLGTLFGNVGQSLFGPSLAKAGSGIASGLSNLATVAMA